MDTDVRFTTDEFQLLIDALDSHEYWQLSEPRDRASGCSIVEDGENPEIDDARRLVSKLEHARIAAADRCVSRATPAAGPGTGAR